MSPKAGRSRRVSTFWRVRSRVWLAATALLAASLPLRAQDSLEYWRQPITARVPFAPTPVRGDDGRTYLIYELQGLNVLAQPVTVTRVEVTSGRDRLQVVDQAELTKSFRTIGVRRADSERLTLDGGTSGLIYLSIVVSEPARLRGPLVHNLTVETGTDGARQAHSVTLLPVPLARDTAVHIGPPLRGGPWLASNGPSNVSGHRRLPIPLNGRVAIPQRFAIDYIKLDSSGRSFSGDSLDNLNWFSEGSEVIAVANARVAAVTDGIPENVPGLTSRAVPVTLQTVGGNAVVLDLGGGRYAHYGHLQPGSLRVKAGGRVRRGQVIGRLGNSGNSIRPHLHFQLTDAVPLLGGEGLPYVHDRFEWIGTCAELRANSCSFGAPITKTSAIPLNYSIIRFP